MIGLHIGLGSIVVENPPQYLKDGLRCFRRNDDGEGYYEDLYSLSSDGSRLATMPGFASRIRRILNDKKDDVRVFDVRMPMPKPDHNRAMSCVHEFWRKPICEALKTRGGTVHIPGIGKSDVAAAIIRAYSAADLMDRGTPYSIVVTRDKLSAKKMAHDLRVLLPDREVGLCESARLCDFEDIIVINATSLEEVPRWAAGILIACNLNPNDDGIDVIRAIREISSVRNAARWGIFEDYGSFQVDMMTEGLFGPVVTSSTYADAVRLGYAVPITVCWLPAPRIPPVGSCPFNTLEAMVTQNEDFYRLLANIVKRTPSEMGVRMYADHMGNGGKLKTLAKESEKNFLNADVLLLATCRADMSKIRLPGRKTRGPKDMCYIVTFSHDWDMHNGHHGYLARYDEARKQYFRALGFRQMYVGDIEQLPFL